MNGQSGSMDGHRNHCRVADRPSRIDVPATNPNSFRALVTSATLRAISPVRGGLNFNSDLDPATLRIISANSRIVVSVPDAMLKTLLLRFFSSAATVASTTSEMKIKSRVCDPSPKMQVAAD